MTQALSSQLRDIAQRHHLSEASVSQLVDGLLRTGGGQVQFDIPEFGGMGQWMPGMVMAGNMFDSQLKARVDAACNEIANLVRAGQLQSDSETRPGSITGGWNNPNSSRSDWPAELGTPSTSGGQNDMRYAWFPSTRRLAIDIAGQRSLYDTADHIISGVSQQQSGGGRTLIFTSQRGNIDLSALKRL